MQKNYHEFSYKEIKGSFRRDYHSRGVIFESHCHPFYEIVMVLSGKITASIEGKDYSLKNSSLAIFPPFVYHSVSMQEEGEYERISVSFSSSLIPSAIEKKLVQKVKIAPVTENDKERVAEKLKKIVLSDDSEQYYPLLQAEIVRLLYQVSATDEASVVSVGEDDICARIAAYVNQNIEKKITIGLLAKEFFLSESAVSHIFKNRMKISVKRYVLQKKISLATSLIESGVPSGEAAKRIGYQNYANFYTIYKKTTGLKPNEVKK